MVEISVPTNFFIFFLMSCGAIYTNLALVFANDS